jgi:arabinogalactan oligomer/maltooligosaccharide transport system substrate-binding protein
LAIAACGSSKSSTTTTTSAAGTSGGTSAAAAAGSDLTIWIGPGSTAFADTINKLTAQFGQEQGIKVTVQTIAKELQTQFVTASQAGQAPDVVLGAHDWIGNLVQNGAIDPVQLTDQTKAALNPLAIKAVTFNGQIYGTPYDMNNIVLFRNTDLVPTAPTSFDDLIAKGKALKAAGKVSEILSFPVSNVGNPYYMYPFFTSGGGYMFGTLPNGDYNPKDLGIGTSGAAQAMAKIAQYAEKGSGIFKRSISTDNALSLFTDKKAAFLVTGPWDIPNLAKTSIKYDVSAVPSLEPGKVAKPFITVDAAYVASKGKHKALAQEFAANFWSTPDVALALFKATSNIPAQTAALAQLKSSDPVAVEISDVGTKQGAIMPSIPAMAAVWDPLGKAQAAIVGGADPTSTMAAAAKTIQAAINK